MSDLPKGKIRNKDGRIIDAHWFYYNDEKQTIHTYGAGDHPQTLRRYEDKEEYLLRKKELTRNHYKAINEETFAKNK